MKTRSGKNKPAAKAGAGDGSKVRIGIKVQPGASRDAVLGKIEDDWKVSLTAPPVEGRANQACVTFLAGLLGVSRSSVTIARGQASRRKLIEIAGLPKETIEEKLKAASQK